MPKLKYSFLVLLLFISQKGAALDADTLTSRFITQKDPAIAEVSDIPLRASWWSRPYEYAWASLFVEIDHVVLDAACGISHPFKWHLGKICKETWASDIDHRIAKSDLILKETNDDLGKEAYETLIKNKHLLKTVHLSHSSICNFPEEMPLFDRIFCISSLEHMSIENQKRALYEFALHLTPKGLIVLTVDYPVVTPDALLKIAKESGLIPAGPVKRSLQDANILKCGSLRIFRCVLKHDSNKT